MKVFARVARKRASAGARASYSWRLCLRANGAPAVSPRFPELQDIPWGTVIRVEETDLQNAIARLNQGSAQ